MKSILQEIREQPPHIRELFMWVCVVITFSVVGFAWFRSTTRQFAVLLNPDQAQARAIAEEQESISPFATILTAMKGLVANISELFGTVKSDNEFEIKNNQRLDVQPPVEPQKLPLSGDKR